ncbi:MAG: TraR/DksA family transcriptional regulator [Akkermansia sp.]|nr:TraR/DksA family transcriptional regulator [Akkermansia sp.]
MATPKKTTTEKKSSAAKSSKAATRTSKSAEVAPASRKAASVREQLTAEEKARVKKLKETLALLKADPEWPAFLEQQKLALLKLRDDLVPNMQNVTRDHLRSGASNVSSSSGQHIGDAGSEAEVRDLTIRLLDKDREQIFEIDAALERIRRGTYGICEISLEIIPKKRLEVRPFCRLTVKCQEEYEKKYGSYANYRAKKQDRVGYADLQNDMENAISLDDNEE